MNLIHIQGKILTVVVAVHEYLGVGGDEGGFLLELAFQEMDGFIHRAVEEPADESECEHVARLEDRFVVQSRLFERVFGELRQAHGHYLHGLRYAKFGEGVVGLVERFLQVFGCESVHVHDDYGMARVHCMLVVVLRSGLVEL